MGTSRSLLPFPNTRTSPSSNMHVANAERDPLRDTQPGAVCQLQHRTVAKHERVIEQRRGEQAFDFVDGEHLRQRPPPLRRLQPLARIAREVSFAEEKPEIGAKRGDVAADRRRREAEVLQVIHVFAEELRRDVRRGGGALPDRIGDEPREVALVGLVRARRRALLEREKVGEGSRRNRRKACEAGAGVVTRAGASSPATTRARRRSQSLRQ